MSHPQQDPLVEAEQVAPSQTTPGETGKDNLASENELSLAELQEPSTEKEPGEEPQAPEKNQEPEHSHEAVGIGVIRRPQIANDDTAGS